MSNERTRIVRTAVQALVAFVANVLLMRFGVDLVEVLDFFGFSQDQLENFVFLAVLPFTTAVVAWLERVLQERLPTVAKIIGWLNGPRRNLEYSLAA